MKHCPIFVNAKLQKSTVYFQAYIIILYYLETVKPLTKSVHHVGTLCRNF